MNIFKRITSFASNSWRDFIENHEPIIDTESTLSNINDDQSHANDAIDATKIIENEENFFIRKSLSHLLLKKRVHKKKTVASILMDDPRSPTNVFARTPILIERIEYNDVLSPFNVTDMLDAVETAIECNEKTLIENDFSLKSVEPKTPVANNDNNDNVKTEMIEKSETIIKNENNDKILKIDEICDWNLMEYKEKQLTESMIVETSTNTADMTKDSMSNQSETRSLIDYDDNDDEDIENANCKVIGYSIKTIENHQSKQRNLNDENFAASTPKKQGNNKSIKQQQQQQRTPLMSISNSPLVKKQIPKNHPINKKRITNVQRKLKKQPSTPMTPLNRNQIQQNLITFDKENY